MKLSTRCLTLMSLLALGSACAASSKSMPAPPAGPDAMMGGEAMAAPADVAMDDSVMLEAGAAPVSTSAASPAPTPAVLGMAPHGAAKTGGGGAKGGKAIADGDGEQEVRTIGADSVDQMLIFNGAVDMVVDAGTTPSVIDAAVDLAVAAGGYISQQTDTTLQLRVPSRRFRKLMRGVERLGEVRSRSVQTLDVSEQFHDLKVRLDNLKATRTRIQKLLGQAKDLNEILRVEQELQRVTTEIDQIEGRLRYLSSQTAFSTVSVSFAERAPEVTIVETEEKEPPPPPPPPARVLDASAAWVGDIGVHRLMRLD